MPSKQFKIPDTIWDNKNISPECKEIYSYLYSKGFDRTIFHFNIGEIIAEAREKKGLSQRQLAKLAKINNSELSKIEAGIRKDPSPRILRKISSIIDVNYSDLMYSIGLGLEVTPLNYFIKNHYSNLNAEELETAEINVLGSIENSEKLVESCEKQLENEN